jgi:hypothetical protein
MNREKDPVPFVVSIMIAVVLIAVVMVILYAISSISNNPIIDNVLFGVGAVVMIVVLGNLCR